MIDGCVPAYKTGTAEFVVNFPIDSKGNVYDICEYCPACKCEQMYSNRMSCRITGEYLFDIQHQRGQMCPLKFKEEE